MLSDILLKKPVQVNSPYREALITLGSVRDDVVVLGADLGNSTEIDGFRDMYPNRFFNVGTAEQNEIGIAVGMAFEGLIPFVHSFGVFITRRAYEQVCVQVAMHKANVKLVGVIPGLTSRLGPTHQAIEDLSLMRTLPNMVVIDPADATEIRGLVPALADYRGPVYTRMLRREVPTIFDPNAYRFEIGKAKVVSEGDQCLILTTGLMLQEVLEAVSKMPEYSFAILHCPTIKPLDVDTILKWARITKRVVVVENHLRTGGLGSAVCEFFSEVFPIRVVRIGLDDTFASPGTPEYLFDKYGLSSTHIQRKIKALLACNMP